MKCYYHVDREAVGTCQTCGKSLCKECASVYSPLTCEDCHRQMVAKSVNERERNKQKALTSSKKEIVKSIIIGLIFALLFSYIMFVDHNASTFTLRELEPVNVALTLYTGFGFPFGWRALKFIPFFYGTHSDSIYTAVLLNFAKVFLALLVGMPALIIQAFILAKNFIVAKKM